MRTLARIEELQMGDPHKLFTIGHTNSELPAFLASLRRFEVDLVIDVRSRPQSGRFPHFSQPDFEMSLREAGLHYLFLGEELGGRPADPKAYREDGLVDYRQRRKSYGFGAGLERVLSELEHRAVALMCAEEDPITCHRFLMICPELVAAGIAPVHIRNGIVLETQREAEDRLLKDRHLDTAVGPSLFSVDRAAVLEDAYVRQAERCGFRVDPSLVDSW
jgi:uncharacterized protein (DUF488 family)